jgi:molybdopterin-synthase adenylyltransferase
MLEAEANDFATTLCGRDAVQVNPRNAAQIDLHALAERLRAAGEVQVNSYLLRLRTDDYELTVFQDARAIIRGTDDIARARSLYAKYIGN